MLLKYVSKNIFTGRARRSEYWPFFIFASLFSLIPGIFLFFSFIAKFTESMIYMTQNIDSYSKNNYEPNIEKVIGNFFLLVHFFYFS